VGARAQRERSDSDLAIYLGGCPREAGTPLPGTIIVEVY
jgi:hypothetical protein